MFNSNAPADFWRCKPNPSDKYWKLAIRQAIPVLGLEIQSEEVERLIDLVLSEALFGKNHWELNPTKRLYYLLKPILPRALTRILRRLYGNITLKKFQLGWPIEARFARFQWEVMRQLLTIIEKNAFSCIHFWPQGHKYAFVLTHDIETAEGQANMRTVANLEERLGFRSSINFVPERYPIDYGLMEELRERGFEIGLHGLKHDGKLFNSRDIFLERVTSINYFIKVFNAVGFRSPLAHRNPEWMQALNIEYDLSFFDTDPFEPIPGGTMSIWPFFIGKFVELPYTLIQDYTLTAILGETTPRLWLEKTDLIEQYHGMALLNSHPDYLRDPSVWRVYSDFLVTMKGREDYWHALPRDVARWWRARANVESLGSLPGAVLNEMRISGKDLIIEPQARNPAT